MDDRLPWLCCFDDDIPPAVADPVGWLGGKGMSLRRMQEMGLTVPPWFTISTACCRRYLDDARTLPPELSGEVAAAVRRLEAVAGRTLGDAHAPLLLAVRSGAPVSLPGLLPTLLGCGVTRTMVAQVPELSKPYEQFLQSHTSARGESTGPDDLPDDPHTLLMLAIAAVMDRWESPALEQYLALHGIDDCPGTAVTVQVMVAADVSGVLFTRDPRDPADGHMLLELVEGAGDAMLAGEQEPVPLRLERESGRVLDAPSPDGSPLADLSEDTLRALVRDAHRLEDTFSGPVDIEFGVVDGQLCYFQVRAAKPASSPEDGMRALRPRVDEQLATLPGHLWVRHNLDEQLACPTLLTWEILREMMRGDGGFVRAYRRLGFRPTPRVVRDGFLERIGGRIYANADLLPDLFGPRLPWRHDPEQVRRDPTLIDRFPTRFDLNVIDSLTVLSLPGNLFRLVRAQGRMLQLSETIAEECTTRTIPALQQYVAAERSRSLAAMTDDELADCLEQRSRRVLGEFATGLILPGLLGGWAFTRLQDELTARIGEPDGPALARDLARPRTVPPEAEHDAALLLLAAGTISRETFLQRFGHRGPDELELSRPRWSEAPDMLPAPEGNASPSPSAPIPSERDIESRLQSALATNGARSLASRIHRFARIARELLPWREAGRHWLMLGYTLLRDCTQEYARRSELGDDVYHLAGEELSQLPHRETKWRELVDRRRDERDHARRLDLPLVFDTSQNDRAETSPSLTPGSSVAATTISGGTGRGPARVIEHSAQPVQPGCVAVIDALSPMLAAQLGTAAAVVARRGGVLSHGALLIRQLGIPAVVCPQLPTIQDGQPLLVDADEGTVSLEEA
ncbi:PEP/pyruvate-binding domain-containing protein [Maioricimonas sp. JC845]|uniref:PEP/pyruvate-binding domain-containing protein n=1 Tax=Maioricimonas sp. JC845 TaxID=3232138 RepID=UPI00345748E3